VRRSSWTLRVTRGRWVLSTRSCSADPYAARATTHPRAGNGCRLLIRRTRHGSPRRRRRNRTVAILSYGHNESDPHDVVPAIYAALVDKWIGVRIRTAHLHVAEPASVATHSVTHIGDYDRVACAHCHGRRREYLRSRSTHTARSPLIRPRTSTPMAFTRRPRAHSCGLDEVWRHVAAPGRTPPDRHHFQLSARGSDGAANSARHDARRPRRRHERATPRRSAPHVSPASLARR
jgi:hypothetical protein